MESYSYSKSGSPLTMADTDSSQHSDDYTPSTDDPRSDPHLTACVKSNMLVQHHVILKVVSKLCLYICLQNCVLMCLSYRTISFKGMGVVSVFHTIPGTWYGIFHILSMKVSIH